jgi:hypothetical protein
MENNEPKVTSQGYKSLILPWSLFALLAIGAFVLSTWNEPGKHRASVELTQRRVVTLTAAFAANPNRLKQVAATPPALPSAAKSIFRCAVYRF